MRYGWWAGAGAAVAGLAGFSAWASRKAEDMVPPDGTFIDVPGARLHYVEMGHGPSIVMVHGLMGQLRNFSYAVAERLAVDHRVILVDRPGWGYSEFTGRRHGVATQAQILAAFIETVAPDKPLLVGHSMGGAVALALGLDRPELVRGLALIAPLSQIVLAPPPQFAALMAPGPLRPLIAWTIATPAGILNGPPTAAAIFYPDPVPKDFAVAGGAALSARPKSYMSGSFELQHALRDLYRMVSRYPTMQLPVSILFGRQDHVLSPTLNGETTATQIPGSVLELIDGGHMLPVTHAVAVEDWVRRAAIR